MRSKYPSLARFRLSVHNLPQICGHTNTAYKTVLACLVLPENNIAVNFCLTKLLVSWVLCSFLIENADFFRPKSRPLDMNILDLNPGTASHFGKPLIGCGPVHGILYNFV